MLSSVRLTDEDLLLRPFRLDDAPHLNCAVRESLKELKPWMSWATDEYSERTAREYITIARARWEEHTFYAFAVLRSDNLLGACTLSSIHPIYHFCNLGLLGSDFLSRAGHCRARRETRGTLCLRASGTDTRGDRDRRGQSSQPACGGKARRT